MSQSLVRLKRPTRITTVAITWCAHARGTWIVLVPDRLGFSIITELDQQADINPAPVVAIEHDTDHVRFCIVTPLKAPQRKIDCNSTD